MTGLQASVVIAEHWPDVGQMPVVVVMQLGHAAGQVPPLGIRQRSQVLAASGNTPSPQPAGQSLSLASMQPGAQQPSPLAQTVTAVCTQCVLQPVPAMVSVVHGSLSSQS